MPWMTQEDAALALGVSPRIVRRRVVNGSLRAMRQGQVILVDVDLSAPLPAHPEETPAPTPEHVVAAAIHQAAVQEVVAQQATVQPVGAEAGHVSPFALRSRGAVLEPPSTEPRGSRWMGVIAWLTTTGLLFTAAIAVWVHHQGNLRYQDIEQRHQRLIDEHQQATLGHEAKLQAITADAEQREANLKEALTSDLTRTLGESDTLRQELQTETASVRELSDKLGGIEQELAATTARNEELMEALTTARQSLNAARVQQAVLNGLPTPLEFLRSIKDRIAVAASPAKGVASASDQSPTDSGAPPPLSPTSNPKRPSPGVRLRSIVEPGEQANDDAPPPQNSASAGS